MTEYERGKRAGLRRSAKIARVWHSDFVLNARYNERSLGRTLTLDERRLRTDAQENAARGIAQDIEKLLKRNME